MLAKCCALGCGMEHNAERAEALVSEAAKKGNDEARFLLQLINDWKGEERIYLSGWRMCFLKELEEENSRLCCFCRACQGRMHDWACCTCDEHCSLSRSLFGKSGMRKTTTCLNNWGIYVTELEFIHREYHWRNKSNIIEWSIEIKHNTHETLSG